MALLVVSSELKKHFRNLGDIVLKTLKTLGELPDRNHLRVQHLLDRCENVLLDGTERSIERPQDSDRQKSCYSGKKNS